MLVGLDPGLAILDLDSYEELSYLDIDIPVTSIAETDEGRFFIASVAGGFRELTPASNSSWGEITVLDRLGDQLEGSATVLDANGANIILGTDSGLYHFNTGENNLSYMGNIGILNDRNYVHRLHCDDKGGI